jgi:hypothetical protein
MGIADQEKEMMLNLPVSIPAAGKNSNQNEHPGDDTGQLH